MQIADTILQAVSVLGVAVSLAFVARQIRQLERSIRGASYQGIVYDPQISNIFVDHPELADMWKSSSYLAVVGRRRRKAQYKTVSQRWIISLCLDHYENIFIQHELGNIPDHLWQRWARHIRIVLGGEPIFRELWPQFKQVYYEPFADFVDEVMSQGSRSH